MSPRSSSGVGVIVWVLTVCLCFSEKHCRNGRGRGGDPTPKVPDPMYSRGNTPVAFSLCGLCERGQQFDKPPSGESTWNPSGWYKSRGGPQWINLKLPATTSRSAPANSSAYTNGYAWGHPLLVTQGPPSLSGGQTPAQWQRFETTGEDGDVQDDTRPTT